MYTVGLHKMYTEPTPRKGGSMATNREGQKQLHVWIAEELKAELEQWRDDNETTYTEIVTQALRRHFEVGHEVHIEARLDRIEGKLERLLEEPAGTPQDSDTPDTAPAADDSEEPSAFDAPTKPTKTVQDVDQVKARRRKIRRGSDNNRE